VSKLRELKDKILSNGTDLTIDEADVAQIRKALPAEGALTFDDVKTLTELRTEARAVCPAFDQYFFPVFKRHLLADGTISLPEQFTLLRLLYGGGGIDANERQFLIELRREVRDVTPEFDNLYKQAISEVTTSPAK
jgi:hypothetical protein